MSRLATKIEKKIKFDKNGKDYIVIRPLSYDEMMAVNEFNEDMPILEEYLRKVRELLDRDPNKEIEKIVNEQLEKIEKFEKEKNQRSVEYNKQLILRSLVKVVDDGKVFKDHEKYLSLIDNGTFQRILQEIIKLNVPSNEKIDFLD